MFTVRPELTKRISFATKLFPRINSALGSNTEKLKSITNFDGEVFCGGRSRNKDLLTFFGCIVDSQRGASTFAQLPLFRRSIKKLVALVERELDAVGAHEVLLPTIIPKKLWHQSKRLERQQEALNSVYSFQDNSNTDLLLGPTYEESMTQLVKYLNPPREHELPLLLYQTSPKFRYEANPRFGLLRSNEFLMNDLYSFDSNLERAKQTYDLITDVYERIFTKLSLKCLRFENVTGSIGGKYSHEYQLPVTSGEDTVAICESCLYKYNAEMCQEKKLNKCLKCQSDNVTRLQTLELAHTFLLSDTYSRPMNAQIKSNTGTKVFYEMGCFGIGLTRIIGAGLDHYSPAPLVQSGDTQNFIQMRWPSGVEPYKLGIVGPAMRSKQYSAGSSAFIEKLVLRLLESTREIDILVEDRDKDGIFKRLAKVQSLGIPNIIVVGQRFLQDRPQVELLRLSQDKQSYEQSWMTEDEVYDFIKQSEAS